MYISGSSKDNAEESYIKLVKELVDEIGLK